MKSSRIISIILVLLSHCGFAQNNTISQSGIKEEYSFTIKSFGKEEGYLIKGFRSSLVDTFGTLWVSGAVENPSKNQFNKIYSSLFFFNGTKFQEFPFPDSIKRGDLKLLKGYDKDFFVLQTRDKQVNLLSINPYTLTYQKIESPAESTEILTHIKPFYYNKKLHILYTFNSYSEIYSVNENKEFERFEKIDIHAKYTPYFEKIVGIKENIVLCDKHSGIYILNKNSKKIEKITATDLGDFANIERKIKVYNSFSFQDTTYFKFNIANEPYYYNEAESIWVKSNINRFPFNSISNHELFNEESDILSFSSRNEDGTKKLNAFLKSNNQKVISIPLEEFTYIPKINSRNYNKEVFVFNQNQLKQISFKRIKVKKFLKKYSVRVMLQLDENRVLVGTELNGIKEINLATGEEKEFHCFQNGKKFAPSPIRGFHQDSTGIYTSYSSGICHINSITRETSTFRYFPITKFLNKGKNIYYTTNGYKLMMFDKQLKKNIAIANTDEINMQDFVFKGDTILAATLSGLYIYHNGNQELVKPSNSSMQFLSVRVHPTLGILVGTINGKVLVYHPNSKVFTELYSDEFNSSIATLLIDKQQDIWINTFKGFIKYNIKNKSTIRFDVQDGFSDNEANRLASLKLKNGNLLIGTVKGLNYFNPSELTSSKINAKLKFTGIEYYDDHNKMNSILSQKELQSANEIILQPQNRNINLSFGFNDIVGLSENLRYKYKLNEGKWRVVNEFGELFLGNLAPNVYKLEIAAINKIERQIGNSIKIKIIAKNFFYKTIWFWTLIGILLAGIIFWIAFQFITKQKLKQNFADKIINAHIEEQASLSQKLHDSVGQKLLLAKNNFILSKKIPKEELTNLDEIISEVRNISHDLHPLQFETLGFKTSVENLVEDFQRNSSIFYSHEINCSDAVLPLEKEIILFGIIQECLNNVEKHSQAEACQVKVFEKKKELKIQIKDNGKGFDINKKSTNFSLGLKTMQEKADYLNANMTFISAQNEGTKVRLNIKITPS